MDNKITIGILIALLTGVVGIFPIDYTYQEEVKVEETYTTTEIVPRENPTTETRTEETRFFFDTKTTSDGRSYHPDNHVVFKVYPKSESEEITENTQGTLRAEIETSTNYAYVSPTAELRRTEQAGNVHSCYDTEELSSPEVLDNIPSGTGTLSAQADSSIGYCVIVKPQDPTDPNISMETEVEMFWVTETEVQLGGGVEREVEKTRETTEMRTKEDSKPLAMYLLENVLFD